MSKPQSISRHSKYRFVDNLFLIISQLTYVLSSVGFMALVIVLVLFDTEPLCQWLGWYLRRYELYVLIILILSGITCDPNFIYKIVKLPRWIIKFKRTISYFSRPMFFAALVIFSVLIFINNLSDANTYWKGVNSYETILLRIEVILDKLVNQPLVVSLTAFCFLIVLFVLFPNNRVASKLSNVKKILSQVLLFVTVLNAFAYTTWEDRSYLETRFHAIRSERIVLNTANIIEYQTRIETLKGLNKTFEEYPPEVNVNIQYNMLKIHLGYAYSSRIIMNEFNRIKSNPLFNVNDLTRNEVRKISSRPYVERLFGKNATGQEKAIPRLPKIDKDLSGLQLNVKKNAYLNAILVYEQEKKLSSLEELLRINEGFKAESSRINRSPSPNTEINRLANKENLLKNRVKELTKVFHGTIKDIFGETVDLISEEANRRNAFIKLFANQIIEFVHEKYVEKRMKVMVSKMGKYHFGNLMFDLDVKNSLIPRVFEELPTTITDNTLINNSQGKLFRRLTVTSEWNSNYSRHIQKSFNRKVFRLHLQPKVDSATSRPKLRSVFKSRSSLSNFVRKIIQ